tara:strand:- start:24 stop:329 length:306 start_codon:yes stop_codon:yes gene_type:complete
MFWKEFLREIMKQDKLSQVALARYLGVNESTVSLWLNGHRKSPLHENLRGYIDSMYPAPLPNDEDDRAYIARKEALCFIYWGDNGNIWGFSDVRRKADNQK